VSKTGTSAPPPVNAGALLTQQGMANNSAAELQAGLNNTGVSGAIGNTWYTPTSIDPGTGMNATWEQSQQLAPGPQNAFNQQTAAAANLASNANTVGGLAASTAQPGVNLINQGINTWGSRLPTSPVSTAGMSPIIGSAGGGPIQSGVNTDFGNQVTQAQNAAYNTQEAYLQPQQAEQTSDLAQQLADQGISAGSSAYDRAQGDLSRSQTFSNQQAQNAAVAAGNQEQSTLFGESLGAGQFANQAQQQGFGQSLSNAALSNAANQQQFGEATTQWGEPFQALQNTVGTGEGVLAGAGSQLPGLGSLGNFTWAGGIPGQGGGNTTVTPPNIGSLQSAANQGNLNSFASGNLLNNQLAGGLGTIGNALGGSNLLFGSGGLSGALGLSPATGLFGGGLAGLFGGGAAAGGAFGTDAGAAILNALPFT
jgi:hypothetical protein